MLPDIGASELMVIAIVALIFVGPKDLPAMLKKLGQFTAKMRRMAADFRTSFDDMARQSELEDLRREVEQMRANATEAMSDPIGINSTLRETIDDIDSSMSGGDPYDYDRHYDAPPEPELPETPKPARKPATRKVSAKAAADKKPASKAVAKTAAAKARPSKAAAAEAPLAAQPKPRKRAVAKAVN